MYYISVDNVFSSAHFLNNYKGKCRNMHGHNWGITVTLCGEELKNGMLVDFTEVKRHLQSIVEKLDHKILNEVQMLNGENPTAENLARIIYSQFENRFEYAHIYSVKVMEGKNTCAKYIK